MLPSSSTGRRLSLESPEIGRGMLRAPQEGERRVRCGVPLFDRRAAGATWEKLLLSVLLSASPSAAQWEIPAGTPFEVRPSTPIRAFPPRPGTPVAALLFPPLSAGERP